MKNKEKYAKEIMDIACSGNRIAVMKGSWRIVPCDGVLCSVCLFCDSIDCRKNIKEWAESEYIEKPVISKKDMEFLGYLSDNIEYIVRDPSGALYIYTRKPYKQIGCWSSSACETEKSLWMFNVDFPMVKWSDSEPWLIGDLKKLEVVEGYENNRR